MFSKQETFNIVWEGFQKQNFARAASDEGECFFKTATGLKCSIGFLIEDELFTQGEDNPHTPITSNYREAHDKYLRSRLMNAHDLASGPADLKNRLITVAKEFGLEIPPG